MPRININEIDNTVYNMTELDNDHIVFVPGSATTGPYDKPVLLTNTYDYENTFGETAPVGSPTHNYVEGLLLAGLPVLFRRIACLNQDSDLPEVKVTKAEATLNANVEQAGGEEEEVTYESVPQLKIIEKYGGTYGNSLSIITEQIGNGVYIRVYIGTKQVESQRIAVLASGDDEETTRAKLVNGIRNAEFERIDIEFVSETPDTDFVMPYVGSTTGSAGIEKGQELTGGKDISNEDVITEISNTFDYIKDKYVYDVKFITAGGYYDGEIEDTPIANAMVKLAETRQDCIAIPDIPQGTPKDQVTTFFANLDTSYAAAFAPWAYLRLPDKTEAWMAPSYIFLYTLGRSISQGNPVYMAPAGVLRASVPQLIKPEYEIGGDMLEYWQGSNPQCINPIMKLRSYGYVIYGQKTLFNIENSNSHLASALQELNTRLVVNEIKRAIFNVAIRLTFQANNQRTWNEFKALIEPTLDSIKANGGITDYMVRMDDTTTTEEDLITNTIRAVVKISVARVAENFEIDFEMEPQSVTFAEQENELNVG